MMLPFDQNKAFEENARRFDEEGTRRFEDESPEFHERVRKGYRILAKKEPKRWKVIDASKPRTEVEHEVWQLILHDHLTDIEASTDDQALNFGD